MIDYAHSTTKCDSFKNCLADGDNSTKLSENIDYQSQGNQEEEKAILGQGKQEEEKHKAGEQQRLQKEQEEMDRLGDKKRSASNPIKNKITQIKDNAVKSHKVSGNLNNKNNSIKKNPQQNNNLSNDTEVISISDLNNAYLLRKELEGKIKRHDILKYNRNIEDESGNIYYPRTAEEEIEYQQLRNNLPKMKEELKKAKGQVKEKGERFIGDYLAQRYLQATDFDSNKAWNKIKKTVKNLMECTNKYAMQNITFTLMIMLRLDKNEYTHRWLFCR